MVMKYNFKCYARRKRDKTIEEYKIFNRSRMMCLYVTYTYLHSRENLAKDFNIYFFFLQNKQYVSIIIQCKRLRNSLLNTEKYCHETWKYLNHLFI